jgi:hypothetical protein
MANADDLYLPRNTDEAIDIAIGQMLKASANLCLAADLSGEATAVDHFVNTAIHLRDVANALKGDEDFEISPDGAEVIDFRTKRKIN